MHILSIRRKDMPVFFYYAESIHAYSPKTHIPFRIFYECAYTF